VILSLEDFLEVQEYVFFLALYCLFLSTLLFEWVMLGALATVLCSGGAKVEI
jgi:hypothetical protein